MKIVASDTSGSTVATMSGAQAERDQQHRQHEADAYAHVRPDLGQPVGGVGRLVEDQLHPETARHVGGEAIQLVAYEPGPDIDLPSAFECGRDEDGGATAVQRGLRQRQARATVDPGDVAQPQGGPADPLAQDEPAQAVQRCDLARDLEHQVVPRPRDPARPDLGVRGGDSGGDGVRGQAQCRGAGRVERDRHLLCRRAEDLDLLRPGHVAETFGQRLAIACRERHRHAVMRGRQRDDSPVGVDPVGI